MLFDRIRETASSTIGLGDVTLTGPATGFGAFSSRFVSGTAVSADPIEYTIEHTTSGQWEVGQGYLSSSTTLVRRVVYDSSGGVGVKVNFSAGTCNVFVTIAAAKENRSMTRGRANRGAYGVTLV